MQGTNRHWISCPFLSCDGTRADTQSGVLSLASSQTSTVVDIVYSRQQYSVPGNVLLGMLIFVLLLIH